LSAGPIAASAESVKRPDSAAVAVDPVNARKFRRDNADMMALPRFFYSWRMPRTPALRKPAIPVHCTAGAQ
jgi:hypothetical protein